MQIKTIKFNNNFKRSDKASFSPAKNIAFTGNISKITNTAFENAKDILNKGYDFLFDNLQTKMGGDLSKVIKKENDSIILVRETKFEKFSRCILYPFVDMPSVSRIKSF